MQQIEKLLNSVPQSKRDNLAKLLPEENFKKGVPPTTEKIIEALRWAHDSTFVGVVFKDPKSYLEILLTVAKHLEIKTPSFEMIELQKTLRAADQQSTVIKALEKFRIDVPTEVQIEQLICQKVGQDIYNKLDKTQRAAFDAAIEKESAKYGSAGACFATTGGVAAALVAGNLGGFSTYMLASTGLAAVSGAMGVTLPFAAYTGLSTALGVALGPVGWVGLGLAALFCMGGPSYDKLIPAILYIVMLRNEPEVAVAAA